MAAFIYLLKNMLRTRAMMTKEEWEKLKKMWKDAISTEEKGIEQK